MGHAIQSAIVTLRAAAWMPMTAARVPIGIFSSISEILGWTPGTDVQEFSAKEQHEHHSDCGEVPS